MASLKCRVAQWLKSLFPKKNEYFGGENNMLATFDIISGSGYDVSLRKCIRLDLHSVR